MSYVQWSRGVSRWFTPLARQVCAFSGVQSLIPVLLSCQRPIRDRTRCTCVFTSAVLPPNYVHVYLRQQYCRLQCTSGVHLTWHGCWGSCKRPALQTHTAV